MTKILVIGNCQARPLSIFLEAGTSSELLTPIVTHLEKFEFAQRTIALYAQADFIFCQLTLDSFPVEHVRSSWIRQRYPEKTVTWPNIFYLGQQPFLRYITHLDLGRLLGPLEAYHDLNIYQGWRRSRGLLVAESELTAEQVAFASIGTLREREKLCDVIVSDLIVNGEKSNRLFYTFNHPTKRLLAAVAARLCAAKEIPFKLEPDEFNEPLARIVPPSILDSSEATYYGHEVLFEDKGIVRLGMKAHFGHADLVELLHKCYDVQSSFFVEETRIRFTPKLS